MFNLFGPSRCDLCGTILRRTAYSWNIDGRSRRLCPSCSSRYEKRLSKAAFESGQFHADRPSQTNWGAVAIVAIGIVAVIGIALQSPHTDKAFPAPNVGTTSSQTYVLTPSSTPAFDSIKSTPPPASASLYTQAAATPAATVQPPDRQGASDSVAARKRDEAHVEWIKHGLPAKVKNSQARALSKHPALSVPGSDLSNAFIEFYRQLYTGHDSILYLDTWPEIVADECEGQLHPTPTPEPVTAREDAVPVYAAPTPYTSTADYSGSGDGSTYVNGYYRKDGTYVHGYTRGSGGHGHK